MEREVDLEGMALPMSGETLLDAVRTTVLRELNRKCECGHGLGTWALTRFRGQEAT